MTWLDFLRSEGAQPADDNSIRFPALEAGATTSRARDAICPLTERAWLQVSGADAVPFLQGQLTNDMEKLLPARWQWAGMCNAKGRLHAVLRALRRGPDILLELPRERAVAVLGQLRKYLLRTKAAVDNLTDDIVAFGTYGEHAAAAVRALAGTAPQRDGDVAPSGDMLIYRVPGPRARLVVLGPSARVQAWWRELRAVAAPTGSAHWRWLDIVSGLPQVFVPTAEEFVPQMMNLDLLDAISFKKGCYTGQEIVARMHYLGRLKQRMVLLHAQSEDCAKPGDRVFATGASDQPAGTVADGQPGAEGGCDLLAVVQLSALAAGPLHLHRAAGPALEKREMPYALPLGG